MEQYKEINRSLTQQNQEMRLQVARFRQDIVLLNRALMSEKEARHLLNCNYVRFVAAVSKLCNDAMKELDPIFEESLPNLTNGPQSEILQDKCVSRRSVRLVQPTLRQIQTFECEKENRKPSDEDIDEIQISYVQTRRRRKADSSIDSQLESTPPTLVETINSSSGIEGSENPERSTEAETSGLVSRNMHTITEENSVDISQSLIYTGGPPIQSLIESETDDDSSIQSTTLLPMKKTVSGIERQIPSVLIDDTSKNLRSHISSRTIRAELSVLTEDTIFDNFRPLKDVCSTPYKPIGSKIVKKCSVRVKRLKPSELLQCKDITIGDSTKQPEVSGNSPQKHKRRKNVSPELWPNRISSSRILTSMNDRSSAINSSNNSIRPKRNAAPINLKEPKIGSKMRRPE